MDILNRNITVKIKRLLKHFPIVVILGVRQCGKSTLVKSIGGSWDYYDLENMDHFDLINDNPILFFKEHPKKVVIDEAQLSPKLFSTLRVVVDEKPHLKSRFILTGSSSFELIKNISESLAGRVAIIELSTLKINEFKKEKLSSFFSIFDKKLSVNDLKDLKKLQSTKNHLEIKKYLLQGGYPQPILKKNTFFYHQWMENYFKTYINRDMRSLFPRIDILKYQRVVKMLSSLSGTIINKSELGRSVEISEKSIRDYIQIISGTFFWRNLPAFKTSKIKNTTSLPKGHYRDSGLLLFLQNIRTLKDLEIYPRLGNVFESFVVEEILKGLDACKAQNVQAYHFRTKSGEEIDLVLEGSFGLLPIEIKYQSSTRKNQLSAMTKFINKHNIAYGVVINNSSTVNLITENIIQIPIRAI